MGDPVTLREEDVSRIGEYVKPWLREVADELFERVSPRAELIGIGPQLLVRMVRVEEELKNQRELMDERFEFTKERFAAMDQRFDQLIANSDKRFQAVDKRFDELIVNSDKRFQAVDKRFDELIANSDKRFMAVDVRFQDLIGQMNRRFNALTWTINVGFVVIALLTTVFALLA